MAALRDPFTNKGTRFSDAEKDALSVRGLVPGGDVAALDRQVELVMEGVARLGSELAKFEYLCNLADRDCNLFYAALLKHTATLMPLVYTPTVGAGCTSYSRLLIPRRGLYITLADAGRVRTLLKSWPAKTVNGASTGAPTPGARASCGWGG